MHSIPAKLISILTLWLAFAEAAEAKLAELLVTEDDSSRAIELARADVKATFDVTTARITYDLSFNSQSFDLHHISNYRREWCSSRPPC